MNFPGKHLLLLALLFLTVKINAQTITIAGTIQDAHTKEPVTFASVYFLKNGIGQTSDSAGNFSFHINGIIINDTLAVSYIGYELYKIPLISIESNKFIKIQLERAGATNAVVVKPKFNKGLFLWKKIMSKKKLYNRLNLENFSYEAYNKLEVDIKNLKPSRITKNPLLKSFSFVLDNIDSTSEEDPFLPAYLVESISDYYFQSSPKKYYEHIRASNTKGIDNESISKLLGVMNQNINIYSNYVNIMDKDFISPFNDNADLYYNFAVPDTQIINGKKIFHFVFRPKRPGQNVFEGDAWVFGQTFQIQKVSLFLGQGANINYIDRISLFQEFIPVNDSVYFLSRDKFFADFRALGKKSLSLIGRKTTSYKNILINSDSIANIFSKQDIAEKIEIDPQPDQQHDSTWEKLRHDTLSANEKAIYSTIDTLLAMPKFNRLQKNIRFLATGYRDVGNIEIGPWYNWISSNIWEGLRFRFDVGTNPGFNKNIYLHGYLAYGLLDKTFKGQAEVYWVVSRDPKRFRLHLSYTDDIDNGIRQVGSVSQDNIFSIAVRKPNFKAKFVAVKDARFEVYNELGKGFSSELFFVHHQYDPVKNLPGKENYLVTIGKPLTSFEIALLLRFAYLEQFLEGDYFRYSLGTKYPIVEAMVTQGIPGVLNSAYDYTKIAVSVKDNIKISPFGTLSYKLYAGKVWGTVPFAFLENHPGNDIYYFNQNAYNLMYRFEYLSDKYAGFNIEHNIGSGIFRFTGPTRKLKFRQFWNVKTLFGSLSPGNTELNNGDYTFKTLDNGKPYIEIGTGVDNILKILRLDLVWRVSPTPLPVEKVSRFGIFGSFHFQF